MRADFTRFPGKMAVRDGVVRGPLVGATVEGNIDYTRDDVHLRGTFVPFYGLNNMFGQIPIVGLFLGGGNKEGLLGINYEAVGPPGAPRITVNPVSAIAPGLLRKFIPSPGTFDPNFLRHRRGERRVSLRCARQYSTSVLRRRADIGCTPSVSIVSVRDHV